jgi:hypothetical protein
MATAGSSSLGKKLLSLPYGLNIVATTIFGQMLPFPAWSALKQFGILNLFLMLSGISWFVVWGYTIYGIVKMKILRQIDVRLKYIFYTSLVYIIVVSSTIVNSRRLMAVYPIIFTIAVLSYINMKQKKRRFVLIFMVIMYIILSVIYLFLKM